MLFGIASKHKSIRHDLPILTILPRLICISELLP